MSFRTALRPHVPLALLGFYALLGASPNASSMYLRLSTMRAAPIVTHLSYDAVATVPKRPHTAAALLAPDRVEGEMTVPSNGNGVLDASAFKGVSTFTVVAVDDRGIVLQRTVFDGVVIHSVRSVSDADGSKARLVEFDAASVTVRGPKTS